MPARWRSSPASRRTPTGTSAASSMPSKRWASWTTRWSSTSGATTARRMEGTITGSFNETTFFNGLVLNAEEQLALIEKFGGLEGLGGFHSAPHFAAAWAHAQNTPFQWGKQMASHLGGDRDPMVVAWPNRIKGGGDLRTQFTHCIDIAPTILDLVGIPEPKVVDGIEQEPMDGTPFSYTLEDPERRGAAYGPVLRDVRQPRHLQGRLVGLRPAGQAAVGLLAGDSGQVQARKRIRPRPGQVGALLPAGRLLAGPRPRRREAGEARRAARALLAGGRAQPGPAAARRNGRLLRRAAPHAHEHPVRVRRRCPERLDRSHPADLRALVLRSRPTSTFPRRAPKASCARSRTSSAASPCGWTRTAC